MADKVRAQRHPIAFIPLLGSHCKCCPPPGLVSEATGKHDCDAQYSQRKAAILCENGQPGLWKVYCVYRPVPQLWHLRPSPENLYADGLPCCACCALPYHLALNMMHNVVPRELPHAWTSQAALHSQQQEPEEQQQHHYQLLTAPRAASTNAWTLSWSFSSPSGPHTPLETSTAVGRVAATASATFPGCRPPASIQPRVAHSGTRRFDQSYV